MGGVSTDLGASMRDRIRGATPHPRPLPAATRGEGRTRRSLRVRRLSQQRGRVLAAVSGAAILIAAQLACADESISLRDMGSFHVGGRLAEITGKPVKENAKNARVQR